MEKKRSNPAFLTMFAMLAGLISQNLIIPVIATTIEDQKNYYSPDPHAGSPPTGSHGSPPHHSGGGHGSTPPHHSGGGYGSSPPSHGGGGSYNPTPSTPPGGGSYDPTPSPPSGGGSYNPTPSTPPGGGSYDPTPSPPSGGGSYNPTPSTPSGGNCGSPPHTPSTPTPSTPTTPSNPPSGGYYNSPPTYGGGSPPTPITVSPPTTPIDPGTPTIPSPPYLPSPSPFTGTCNYWRNHPGIIWGLLGWWGTLGSAFGGSSLPGYGASLTLPEALSNSRADALGALYREGTASFLNSLVNNRFPYSTQQVRDRFVASLSSNKAAAAQARLFRMANEGRMKPRA